MGDIGKTSTGNATLAPGSKIRLPGGNMIKVDAPGAKIGKGKGNSGRGGGEGRMQSRWKPLIINQ